MTSISILKFEKVNTNDKVLTQSRNLLILAIPYKTLKRHKEIS